MPAKTTTVGLGNLVGKQGIDAWEKTKDKKYVADTGGQLPPGIEGGIAKVKALTIGVFKSGDNKGKPFFMGQAVVMEPKEHAGRQCSIGPFPICESKDWNGQPVSFQENWDTFVNHLKGLGLTDPKALHPNTVETAMAALAKAGIFTKFRTWARAKSDDNPNPKTKVYWQGSIKYNGQAPAAASAVQDNTAPAEETHDEPAPQVPEDSSPAADEVDLDTLASEAMENESYQVKIKEIALGLGIDENWIDNEANTWDEVVSAIRDKQTEAASGAPAEEWKPAKDLICFYTPPKAKRAVEVKITQVNKDGKTVELVKASDAKVKFSKVPVDKLEHD